jgi:hypothetical protein
MRKSHERKSYNPRSGRSVGRRRPTPNVNRIETVWPIRLSTTVLVSSNGSGACVGFIPADPSSSGLGFAEFPAVQSLFAEIKVTRMRVTWLPALTEVKTLISGRPMGIAPNLANGGTPSSYETILDNAQSRLWNGLADTSPRGFRMTLRHPSLTYASIVTPNPGSYAGCPGGFGYYGDTFPNTTNLFLVQVECWYLVRSRV